MPEDTGPGCQPLRRATASILVVAQFGVLGCATAQSGKAKAVHQSMVEVQQMASAAIRLPFEGELPSLEGATAWLNAPPQNVGDLRGKVVLIDFWTFTCINWQRQLPYVRAWSDKYKAHGLVVIGVHSPEFPFERDIDNVRRAIKALHVEYPVAIDNDFKVWQAFNNEYWPALYFVDAKGHIRHHQFGEGDYARSESILRQLLNEANGAELGQGLVSVDPSGAQVAADWNDLGSSESYLGYERTTSFSSSRGLVTNKQHTYAIPEQLALNHWALSGDWTSRERAIALNESGGRIAFRFHARDLHLVMAPAVRGTSIRFRVLIDGKPPGDAHGADVDDHGSGTLTEPGLYQLIRQPKPIVDRLFEIEFLDSGAEAFAFTFG